MPRNNFTPFTKEILGQSVGFACVRPGCAKPTTALNSSTGNIYRLGYAAHDSAAAPGGPRFNDDLTPEQRKALENGAHLCPTCARLVDIDPERFPVGTIQSWQQNAMEYRRQRMHMPHPPVGLDFKAGCEAAQKFIRASQNILIDQWSKSVSSKSIYAMEELVRSSYPMSATNPICAQFPHMVNLQLEMLESVKLVVNEVRRSECWFYDNDSHSYFLARIQTLFPTPQEQQTNAFIEHSYMLVTSRFGDFLEKRNELASIANSPYPSLDLYGW